VGNGHLFEQHSLQIHAELIDRLPAILRVYVGCAEKLYGSIDSEAADLVKIHVQSGKLSLLRFDDFHNKPLPRLVERIKINMPQREVDFFDYANDKAAPRLTMKSRYMSSDQEGYERQATFDAKLQSMELFDLNGYGPDAATLARGLTQAGYRVAGFDIVPR
jgi:DNA phosphorothioation-associated putative methyltransferase